jgi:hypothetical protein
VLAAFIIRTVIALMMDAATETYTAVRRVEKKMDVPTEIKINFDVADHMKSCPWPNLRYYPGI